MRPEAETWDAFWARMDAAGAEGSVATLIKCPGQGCYGNKLGIQLCRDNPGELAVICLKCKSLIELFAMGRTEQSSLS